MSTTSTKPVSVRVYPTPDRGNIRSLTTWRRWPLIIDGRRTQNGKTNTRRTVRRVRGREVTSSLRQRLRWRCSACLPWAFSITLRFLRPVIVTALITTRGRAKGWSDSEKAECPYSVILSAKCPSLEKKTARLAYTMHATHTVEINQICRPYGRVERIGSIVEDIRLLVISLNNLVRAVNPLRVVYCKGPNSYTRVS